MFETLDSALAGGPEWVITLLIITIAILGLSIAAFGSPTLKLGLLVWWILP